MARARASETIAFVAHSSHRIGSGAGRNAWIFAYGSLLAGVDGAPAADGVACELMGWRRRWTVAMDNGVDLPGYKHYLDAGGERPAIMVAFLDIAPAKGSRVNGLALPVGVAELAAVDERERNYARLEVGASLRDAAPAGTVWTYVGLPAARERARRGLAEGRLVISRRYWERVRTGFARLGDDALIDFDATTDSLPCPLVDLRVVAHGPASAHAS